MRSQHIGHGLKGYYKMASLATKFLNMTKLAKKRLKVINFAFSNNIPLAVEAYGLSKSTVYRWIRLYHEFGISGLENRSRAPIRTISRKDNWDRMIVKFIFNYRYAYNFCGENIIYPHLKKFCKDNNLDYPGVSTIKRIISDNKDIMDRKNSNKVRVKSTHPTEKVLRKPLGWRPEVPGGCVAIDSIHLNVKNRKFYATTFIDTYSRFAFANVSSSITSKSASSFMDSVINLFPFKVLRVLSDNGSEFKKHFTQALKDRKVTHWKIYPGKPQLNAICERFNRTIKEDFLMLNKELLISDPQLFYSKLSDWLFWYNTERAHHGLGYNTPMHQIKKQKNSNRLWTYTISL